MEDSIDFLKTHEDDFTSYTAELKEGQLLGENKNYRLEKNLGAGGMGEVWLATEIRNRQEIRKVVVKTIRPDRRGNEGAQEKALKQFQLIQKLNHQNICPIYVIEQDPACGCLIVMGYADGGSYADWFAAQPKPLAEVCKVLRPIADALDFAHSKGVIHRDVKPTNMMFTSDSTPWLIDFGIAARLRSESMARTGQFSQSGTVSYMAPEQKTGQLQTAQTDEYSLAMVALEFLTGSLSPLSALLLSPEIQPILMKALAPEPSARYATCRAFIDALSGAIRKDGGSPSAAGPAAKTAIDQIAEAERLAAEAKRRAEEEVLQKKIQALDELVAEEYQSGRYAEAIAHLNEILQLKPDHQNAKWLLNSATQKWEAQKKAEAERKAREEAERKERERKAREEANRKAREEAERKAREEAKRKAREEAERKAREESLKYFTIDGTILKKYTGKETEVIIPEGVTKIGKEAFWGCSSLTSVVISDSVKEIGAGAFGCHTPLKEWSISSGHPYFKTDGTGLLTKDGKKLVACLASATEYKIPEGVTEIRDYAFSGCSSLTSVVIPEGVTEIGGSAFSGCSSLTSVVIPKGVTEIRAYAFSGCSSLTSVVIPEGVTVIRGDAAFSGCRSLTSVVIPKGVTEIGLSAFDGCSSLTSVVIPEGVTEIGGRAFFNCRSLTSVVIPEGVTKIGWSAFNGCRSLTSVVIPEGVTKIGSSAFQYCRSLTSVVIPEGVTEIGERAFFNCSSLKHVKIPQSVTVIGEQAFEDCPVPWFSRAWWHK